MRSDSARSILFCALVAAPLGGCLEPEAPANTQANAGPAAPVRRFRIEHERCDATAGEVQAVDLDGDGKADLQEVRSGPDLVCRMSDLNLDGRPDVFEYFEAGRLRRRESNLVDSSFVTVAETFEAGRITLAEYDTKGVRKVDTWDHVGASGNVEARERDADGDGRVDEWWTFSPEGIATVRVDTDGDGEPDGERRPQGVR